MKITSKNFTAQLALHVKAHESARQRDQDFIEAAIEIATGDACNVTPLNAYMTAIVDVKTVRTEEIKQYIAAATSGTLTYTANEAGVLSWKKSKKGEAVVIDGEVLAIKWWTFTKPAQATDMDPLKKLLAFTKGIEKGVKEGKVARDNVKAAKALIKALKAIDLSEALPAAK